LIPSASLSLTIKILENGGRSFLIFGLRREKKIREDA
jgi:hypothetical protein